MKASKNFPIAVWDRNKIVSVNPIVTNEQIKRRHDAVIMQRYDANLITLEERDRLLNSAPTMARSADDYAPFRKPLSEKTKAILTRLNRKRALWNKIRAYRGLPLFPMIPLE